MPKNALCKKENEVQTLDSREVAEMMGVEHKELLRTIRVHIKNLTEGEVALSKYFRESTYKDSTGRKLPKYDVTKRGCEYIAHKMQGVKGAVFTDRYMDKFDAMEQVLKEQPRRLTPQEELRLHYQVLEEQTKEIESVREEVTGVREEFKDLKDNMPLFNSDAKKIRKAANSVAMRVLGGYGSDAYNDNSLRAKVYKDIYDQIHREFGVASYDDIKRCQFDIAMEIVQNYKAPTVLVTEISNLNNQMRLA